MNDQDYSMDTLLEEVREAVRDAVKEVGEDYDEDDLAWAIADSFVPIFTYDVLQYALHNVDLALAYEQEAVDTIYAVALEEIENIHNETGTTNENEG